MLQERENRELYNAINKVQEIVFVTEKRKYRKLLLVKEI